MRTVITFWQTPEDEQDFLKYLNGTGDVIVCTDEFKATEEELTKRPLSQYSNEVHRDKVLIALKALEADVRLAAFSDPDRVCFDYMRSSVLGYEPVKFRDGKLTPSNISAHWDRLAMKDGKKIIERKPEEFVKWGQKIMRWVRKHASERTDALDLPLTSRALRAMKDGLELIKY